MGCFKMIGDMRKVEERRGRVQSLIKTKVKQWIKRRFSNSISLLVSKK